MSVCQSECVFVTNVIPATPVRFKDQLHECSWTVKQQLNSTYPAISIHMENSSNEFRPLFIIHQIDCLVKKMHRIPVITSILLALVSCKNLI